jgi:predicted ABC-type transport system involved in lysophospholipase L1 biosynthesis ATPase subunit
VRSQQASLIMVTHDPQLADRADRVLNLTIMVVAATPEDERDFGVEGVG